MTLAEEKFQTQNGPVFLTGVEAIVRLLLEKQKRDAEQFGDVNETFVSGYEGSPLGGLDLKVVESLEMLNQAGRTVHQFGVNEKTAASAMLGTQYATGSNVDAFWYGKAHGTMWIPDEIWLANLAGSSQRGSMVLLCGEDHRSKSSVSPGTSDWVLRSSLVPTFYPSSVEEIISLGMHAILLSRYLGVVTALKLVTPICDGASTVNASAARFGVQLPDETYRKAFSPIVMALGALPMQRELVERKIPLAEQYVRLNGINRIHDADAGGEIGIVASGKSYVDVRLALQIMNVRLPILQLSVTYPLDGETIRQFAAGGLKRVIVVEEPGPFVEDGVKAALWDTQVEEVLGQVDEGGNPFIPSHGEIEPEDLVRLLWPRLKALASGAHTVERLEHIVTRSYPDVPSVVPMSCGGCPYNLFRDLKGEKPGGAIGCSSIRAMEAYDMGVLYIPTMGAGGSIYSGTAPFNDNKHIFQYLGDGSYFHSGRGAIQSCVQADVNITFLLLFNGAVALTGGQRPGGQRSIPEVAQELLGLGVKEVGIVTESPQAVGRSGNDVRIYRLDRHPQALERHKELRGTSVIILDKECATEKGRRRRRLGISPEEYILIDEEMCEGCGDCYRKSEGCAALYSEETEFGPKTRIRQTSCVQDSLCVEGECPSFVSVRPSKKGGLLQRMPEGIDSLPEPPPRTMTDPYTIFSVGRGGTGVVTISHVLAYAAMADGFFVYLSNNTGLAQKGGPVEAPIVLSKEHQPAFNRLTPGATDLYLGFDLLRAAEPQNLKFAAADRSVAVVSTTRLPTASMNRNPDRAFPDPTALSELIDDCSSKSENVYLDTYWLAEQLFADAIYANVILVGAAYQVGLIPLKASSIEEALRLNGRAVESNIRAFRWGRLAVADPTQLERRIGTKVPDAETVISANRSRLAGKAPQLALHEEALEALSVGDEARRQLSVRIVELCEYQGIDYAREYVEFIRQVNQAEIKLGGDHASRLSQAVIVNLYKLMAYKDEYEIARLATKPSSLDKIRSQFDGAVSVSHHLHPPSLRRFGVGKIQLGPWFQVVFGTLKRLRWLRGTWADPFGRTRCRRLERELIAWYRSIVSESLSRLDLDTYGLVTRIAESPDGIRGYEDVKVESAARTRAQVEDLLQELRRAVTSEAGSR
jgi:indolepyruvate ferredoxin oxidoreductase